MIIFGEDWKYSMGRPIDNFGNYIDVEAKLDTYLNPFAIYSTKFNNIKITGDYMERLDIPRYQVTILVDFIDVFGVQ